VDAVETSPVGLLRLGGAKLSQRFAKLEYNIIGNGDLRSELRVR
jgi:hypothetical protein